MWGSPASYERFQQLPVPVLLLCLRNSHDFKNTAILPLVLPSCFGPKRGRGLVLNAIILEILLHFIRDELSSLVCFQSYWYSISREHGLQSVNNPYWGHRLHNCHFKIMTVIIDYNQQVFTWRQGPSRLPAKSHHGCTPHWFCATSWHPWHTLHFHSVALSTPGHHTLERKRYFVFTTPRCPSCATILDRIKWEIKPPLPPNQWWTRGLTKARHFFHHWNGGRGGLNFSFILSKIVGCSKPDVANPGLVRSLISVF